MKKYYFTFVAFCFLSIANGQIINFPDANFKAKLLTSGTYNIARNLAGSYFKIDSNSDGEIQESEALQVKFLYITNANISSVVGLEYFINLFYLNCQSNLLTNLNFTSNSLLGYLDCSNNILINLNVLNNIQLNHIDCTINQLSTLNLSNNINLITLECWNNLLTVLDLNNLTKLNSFDCYNNLFLVHDKKISKA